MNVGKHLSLPGSIVCVLLTLLTGCDSGPELNAVSGRVTYQGKPVPDVILHFMAADGRPGQALTDQDGKFAEVVFDREHNGLLTDKYDVVMTWVSSEPRKSPIDPLPPPPAELQPILKEYGDFTNPKIHITIEKGQKTLELNLD